MDPVDRAATLLRGARRIVVVTGAGISAESGVPTFRDSHTGEWARHDLEKLATPEAFDRHPGLVSKWYDDRRRNVMACKPNAAHLTLAEWQQYLLPRGGQLTILTQNVDGLHQRAGSTDVVELHGSLFVWRCTLTGKECRDLPLPLPHYPMPSETGGVYRPGIVWFGEVLPEAAIARSYRAIQTCDAVLSVGTSAIVYPAAGFVELAQDLGAVAVEVNRDPTPLSETVDISLRGQAGEILPRLFEAVQKASI